MNATFAEVRGHEVYVYVRGQFVMKRWLDTGREIVFYAIEPRHTRSGRTTTYACAEVFFDGMKLEEA